MFAACKAPSNLQDIVANLCVLLQLDKVPVPVAHTLAFQAAVSRKVQT